MTFEQFIKIARKHVGLTSRHDYHPACLPENIRRDLSDDLNLETLQQWLSPVTDKKAIRLHEEILVAEAYTRILVQVDCSTPPQNETANSLKQWVMQAILPTGLWAERAPFSPSPRPALTPNDITRLQSQNIAGLHLLHHLEAVAPSLSALPPPTALVTCIASFTDPHVAWSSAPAASLANTLLAPLVNMLESSHKELQTFLTTLLSERVKPPFSKSKNPAITPAGRKAIAPLPSPFTHMDKEEELYPWRYNDIYIIPVFGWILHQLDATSLPPLLSLLSPPLLSLLDTPSTPIKAQALTILPLFLQSCPTALLHRTGLGSVFHAALLPALTTLPTLFPEPDSLLILGRTYPALLALVRTLHPSPPSPSPPSPSPPPPPTLSDEGSTYRSAKLKALNGILRQGVLKGYALAGENVKIAELLIRQMTDIIAEMGIGCVRHLKFVLPLLTNPLTSPFALASPALLSALISCLQSVIVHARPRVWYYRGVILEGLLVCWIRIWQEEQEEQEEQGEQEEQEEQGGRKGRMERKTKGKNARERETAEEEEEEERRKKEKKKKGEEGLRIVKGEGLRIVKGEIEWVVKLVVEVLREGKEKEAEEELKRLVEVDGRLKGLLVS